MFEIVWSRHESFPTNCDVILITLGEAQSDWRVKVTNACYSYIFMYVCTVM